MREKAIVEINSENKIKLRFLVLTFLLVVFYTSLIFGATIYIDPGNTASNQNGTITNPYSSWSMVTFTNGNTYLQKRGTIYNTTGGISLTGRNNITLGAYGTGAKPVIRSSSSTARIIRLTNSTNCVVRDLEVTSNGNVLGPIAIGIDGSSSNNLIDSCLLHTCEYGLNMNVTVGMTGNRILHTTIHTTGDDGMYLKDMKDIEIGYCNIYDVNRKYLIDPDQSYSAGDCMQLVGNQSTSNALVVNIHDNNLDHSSMGNKFCIIIVGDYYSGTIANNVLTGSNSTSCMYLWHTTGTMVIKNNTIQDGVYAIYSYVHDLQVQYNKIMNNHQGIMILPSALAQTNITALNNTFYNNTGASITISNSSSTLVSRNNVFYLNGSGQKAYSTVTNSVTSNYNNFNVQQNGFINNYSTLSSWRSATGNDLNSFVANPMFVSPSSGNLCLQAGSPCINTGMNVSLQYDYYGTPVPQGNMPDIGHYEYTTSQGGTNHAPVISNQTFQVNENSANGTQVGTVVASDPDAGQTLTYTITGGNTSNAFALNASSGLLTVANSAALNYETTPSFGLTVRVTDNGSSSMWSQATVTINLANVNENPVIANQSFSVLQNAANGTAVGTVTASDPDQGQTLSFSITSGNTNSAFAVNSSSGVISVANSAAVVQGTFYLTVRATDNGSPVLYTSATITITVNASVNLAPVINNQSFGVLQNAPNGTLVGTVVASDPNAGQVLTYSIVSGNTSNAFYINPSSGNLTVANSSALYPQTFSLVVRVTDNGSPSMYSQATVTIVVGSSNQNPVIVSQSFSVIQYSPNGTLIGTVVASDPDAGQSLTYSIVSGNTNNALAINSGNGHLSVGNSIYLTQQVFSLIVRVTDDGIPNLYSQATITVTVTGAPNQAPVIANQSFSVAQNASAGTLVGMVSASDPDAGQSLTYTITAGNTSSVFAINATSGQLTVSNASALTVTSFYLTVRVTDNGTPALWSQATITVNVIAETNQSPVILSQSFSVVSNSPNGTLVGTVVATDPNQNQTLTYSITSGNTNNVLAINAVTGNLTVANSAALTVQTLSLIVRATDNGSPNLNAQATVTVNVTAPANQAPVIANQSFSIEDTAPNGTFVGNVAATDPDSGQTITYSIVSGNTGTVFFINSSSGNLWVANAANLNSGTYYLTVRVTDNGNPALWSQAVITVSVASSANQTPVMANQTFAIDENSPNGSVAGTVVATDPDPGQSLSYSIVSGNTNNAFAINSSTGTLTVNNYMVINYEYIQSFVLVVRATDNGNGNLYTQATVTVNINNLNEAPVLNEGTYTVAQYAYSGTFVGLVTGSDPDIGQSVSYQIISGNTNNAFVLNSNNGALNVVNSQALNPATNPVFYLTVSITDNGQPSLSSTGVITINVVSNKNDNASSEQSDKIQADEVNFTVYPNPSPDGIFNLKSDTYSGTGDVQVYDVSGKLLFSQTLSGDLSTRVDLSQFPKGSFIFRVNTGNGIKTYKAIRN